MSKINQITLDKIDIIIKDVSKDFQKKEKTILFIKRLKETASQLILNPHITNVHINYKEGRVEYFYIQNDKVRNTTQN